MCRLWIRQLLAKADPVIAAGSGSKITAVWSSCYQHSAYPQWFACVSERSGRAALATFKPFLETWDCVSAAQLCCWELKDWVCRGGRGVCLCFSVLYCISLLTEWKVVHLWTKVSCTDVTARFNSLQVLIRASLLTCCEIIVSPLIISAWLSVYPETFRSDLVNMYDSLIVAVFGTGSTTKQFVKLADELSVIAARVGKYGFKEKSRAGLKLRLLSRHQVSKMSAGTWRINNTNCVCVCVCVCPKRSIKIVNIAATQQ